MLVSRAWAVEPGFIKCQGNRIYVFPLTNCWVHRSCHLLVYGYTGYIQLLKRALLQLRTPLSYLIAGDDVRQHVHVPKACAALFSRLLARAAFAQSCIIHCLLRACVRRKEVASAAKKTLGPACFSLESPEVGKAVPCYRTSSKSRDKSILSKKENVWQ